MFNERGLMCKYCEEVYIERDGGFNLTYTKIPPRNPAFEVHGMNIRHSGPYITLRAIDGEIDINYCPMCGRNLREAWQETPVGI